MLTDHLTAADRLAPIDDKRARAIRYLRARGKYCLDLPVKRLPKTARPPTFLERWLSTRPALR